MAVTLALDTNTYASFRHGDKGFEHLLDTVQEVMLPLPVLAELRTGFLGGTKLGENEKKLAVFLRQPNVSVLIPDEDTTRHYAALVMQLRVAGTPIPTNDIWIAALVLQHGYTLATRDVHFRLIPQLALAAV